MHARCVLAAIAVGGTSGGALGGEPVPCAPEFLSQQNIPAATKSMVGCYAPPAGSPTFGLSYARLFVAPPGGVALTCVEFGVAVCTPGGHPISAHLWIDGVEVAASAPVLVPQIDQAAEIGAWTASFPSPVIVAEGTSFLLEVRSPTRVPAQGGDGGLFFFAGNQAGETAPTLVKTPECGAPEFVPLTSLNPFATTVVHLLAWYDLPRPTPCAGDLDGNGAVDGADLGLLLGSWGGAAGDLDGDGLTDGADLGLLLGAWGPCR